MTTLPKSFYRPATLHHNLVTEFCSSSRRDYAIDPSTLSYHYDGSAGPGKALPDPIWAFGAPPNYVTAKACLIDWPLYLNSVPGVVPEPGARKCVGDEEGVVLRPYRSTRLHMVDLQTVNLRGV